MIWVLVPLILLTAIVIVEWFLLRRDVKRMEAENKKTLHLDHLKRINDKSHGS